MGRLPAYQPFSGLYLCRHSTLWRSKGLCENCRIEVQPLL